MIYKKWALKVNFKVWKIVNIGKAGENIAKEQVNLYENEIHMN